MERPIKLLSTETEGDRISNFGGEKVESIDELHHLLIDEKVGIKQTVTVIRRIVKLELEITPLEREFLN